MNLQKLADIYDWFDPVIDGIIREHLKAIPMAGRRQWEFAMIFRALQEAGKLTPQSRGLAVGAGTERLIFSIARLAGKVVVTDLYEKPEGWAGVRTADPQAHVMARAPWPLPEGRITAMTMDMRKLEFADDSFDFCWSTGSIEHIGGDDDFVTHFNEVHRVLKPGGVYALTTVCTFSNDTDRLPHNYYFHPRHLMELAHASRLHPAPVFDCRIREHTLNRPTPERFAHYGFAAGDLFRHALIALRRGVINVPNTVIFTKAEGPKARPEIVGFEQSRAWLRRSADAYTRRLWSDWQTICYLDGKAPPQQFPRGTIEVEAPAPVDLWSTAIGFPTDKKKEQHFAAGRFSFEARPDRLYIFRCVQPVRARHRRPGQTSADDAGAPAPGRWLSWLRRAG